jgi:hypothetical protein
MLRTAKGNVAFEMFLPTESHVDPITLCVIPKASSRTAADDILNNMPEGIELKLQMRFAYIPARYWRAAIRAAYLAVFKAQGYQYILSEGATKVRSVVNESTPAPPHVIMQAFPEQVPPGDIPVMPHSFVDAGECCVVLLRIRSKKTRYLAVLLPGKAGSKWEMFGTLHDHAPRLRIVTTPHGWNSPLVINLGYDPEAKFRMGEPLPTHLRRT